MQHVLFLYFFSLLFVDTNKLVVITGGIQPNTEAMAEKYVAAGAKVVVLTETEAQLPGAVCYTCDIGVYEDVEKTFAAIKADLGPVDILIHNPIAACGKSLPDALRCYTIALIEKAVNQLIPEHKKDKHFQNNLQTK